MSTLYLIYDGECMLCRNTALAIKIQQSVGRLELINARNSHPLVDEALAKGYDLNEGILVKFNNQFYYGAQAIHFLALMGTRSDLFNKMNSFIFKHKWTSIGFYPLFKIVRNTLLALRKTPPISKPPQKTTVQLIFGEFAEKLPVVLQKRYANRPYSKDVVKMQGHMDVTTSKLFRFFSPLFRFTGALVPYSAKDVVVNIELISHENSNKILMHRTFHYQNKAPYHFSSRFVHIKSNLVIEQIRFRFAVKFFYHFDGNKIIINYGGYAFCLGKWLIPLPIGLIFGKLHAFEEALSDDSFYMQASMSHPLFGEIFKYEGKFQLTPKVSSLETGSTA